MINLPIPDHLQAMLVDDWENITKNNQLVPLPHEKPVAKILDDYLAHERPNRPEGSASFDILEEVMAGFREYFEKALSRILLYRYSRLSLACPHSSCTLSNPVQIRALPIHGRPQAVGYLIRPVDRVQERLRRLRCRASRPPSWLVRSYPSGI